MLDAFGHLLCFKLCRHNRPVPKCTVVTWSDLRDSVKVVWMTNNNEIKRITVQNVAKSLLNNLTMYTDNYNTSEITLQDNEDEFSCQVEFNITSSVNHSNVFILNITGK